MHQNEASLPVSARFTHRRRCPPCLASTWMSTLVIMQVALAQRLEKHELVAMRAVAALLFKMNKRWEQSIALSKADGQFKDAINTVAQSGDANLAEGLAKWFLERGDKESFAAMLYTCYGLIRPDVAMELSWRHRCSDMAMPYFIQYIRNSEARIASLEAKLKPKEDEAAAHAAAAAAGLHPEGMGMMGTGVLAIADTPYYANYATGAAGAVPGYGMPGYGAPGMGGYGAPGMGGY